MGATARREPVRFRVERRCDQAVLGPRRVLHLDVDSAADTDHPTEDRAHASRAEGVPSFVAGDRQRVRQRHRAGRRDEGRLQKQGVVEVPAGDPLGTSRRADGPMPGAVVQDAAEHRRAVEAREAEPVDRAAKAHQCAERQVGEQRVVGDGQAAHGPGAGPSGGFLRLGPVALVDLGLRRRVRDVHVELDEELLYHAAPWPPPVFLSQPWKWDRSPASHASRSPGVLRSQSGRISRLTVLRSWRRSSIDGRPQNQ